MMWMFFVALVAMVIMEGAVRAQSQACLEIQDCLTDDFTDAIRGTETEEICKIFRETLDCMTEKTEQCLPTLDSPAMASLFTKQKVDMERNIETQCGSQGRPKVTSSNAQHGSSQDCAINMSKCMAPAAEHLGKSDDMDIERACSAYRVAIGCLNDLKDTCAEMVETSLGQMQAMQTHCGNAGDMEGCSMTKIQDCSTKMNDKDAEASCKAYPEFMKCIEMIKNTCKSQTFQDVLKQGEEQSKMMLKKCKEEGYSVGDADEHDDHDGHDHEGAAGSVKPSAVFVLVSALLLALRLHF